MAASKKTVMTNIRVEITPDLGWLEYRCRTMEDRRKYYMEWAKEFQEFLRDHRSQDVNGIDVIPDYEDQCDMCHRPWETYFDDDGLEYCAYCGEPVEDTENVASLHAEF